jgi:uracil phosphoribosyltransferase
MDAKVKLLSRENSYLNHILQELRDEEIQQDRLRFRTNLNKVGELLAFEMSKALSYQAQEVTTPLGNLKSQPTGRSTCGRIHSASGNCPARRGAAHARPGG